MNKGRKASQLLWNLLNHKPKKHAFIEALKSPAGLTTDHNEMNVIIEEFFEKKFNTSFITEEVIWEAELFTDETSEQIMRPITLNELSKNIGELKSDKAEGLDGVTNDMLKNKVIQVELGWKPVRLLIELNKQTSLEVLWLNPVLSGI